MSHDSGDACEIRVVSIYSTPWQYTGSSRKGLSDKLALGGLERHYELYKDQLPRLLPLGLLGGRIGEDDIQLARTVAGIEMSETDAMLFAPRSGTNVFGWGLLASAGELSCGDG